MAITTTRIITMPNELKNRATDQPLDDERLSQVSNNRSQGRRRLMCIDKLIVCGIFISVKGFLKLKFILS